MHEHLDGSYVMVGLVNNADSLVCVVTKNAQTGQSAPQPILDSVKAFQNILRREPQDHRASVRTGCGRRGRQEPID